MASRREAQQSDNTVDSWTSSLVCDMERNLQLEEKLSKEAETPQELLHRLLSTKSAVSTASSFARTRQAANGTKAAFREIGTGSIGKDFEQPGTPWAFKVLLVDRHSRLWNNYIMHLRIQLKIDRAVLILFRYIVGWWIEIRLGSTGISTQKINCGYSEASLDATDKQICVILADVDDLGLYRSYW